jgi:hypothetical protein
MSPATGPALIILVAFVLPGFVTVLLQEHMFKSADDPTPLDRLLRIVAYSVVSYLLIAIAVIVLDVRRSDILHEYHRYTADPAQLVWRGVLLVLVPAVIVAGSTLLLSRWRRRGPLLERIGLNSRHNEPTAWDFFFRQARNAYVTIRLVDGHQVAGYYGSESFAAYAKDGRDLFLEQGCDWDAEAEWFAEPVPESCGIWVNTTNAVLVEFYTPGSNGETTQQNPSAGAAADREEGRPPGAQATGQAASSATASQEAGEVDDGQTEA